MRPDLVSDCVNCAAVCCVATSFEASEDFAFAKEAGVPCPYLRRDHRCRVHDELAIRGFSGCAVYDCHGAGQRVTREFPERGRERDEAFLVLRVVHELLWLLTQAVRLCPPSHPELRAALEAEVRALDAIGRPSGPSLSNVELGPHRHHAQLLLHAVGKALGSRRKASRALVVLR